VEKTIHLEQGEYRDEKIKVYVGKEGTDIVIFGNTLELVGCNEETKDYSEEFAALQERFDALKETIERKVYLELQFQSRRINKLEKAVIEKREKNERTPEEIKESTEKKIQKIDEFVSDEAKKLFNPDFYTKPCKPRGGRPSAIPLSEIKERILDYAKEKDPGGQGFTFRYGAGNSAPVESRSESQEISKKVSGDKRRVKIALLELIDEGKIARKPHAKRQNTFIYFFNGKQKTETPEQTKEELLKN
jgi:hypothetical protein